MKLKTFALQKTLLRGWGKKKRQHNRLRKHLQTMYQERTSNQSIFKKKTLKSTVNKIKLENGLKK